MKKFIPDSHNFEIIKERCLKNGLTEMQSKPGIFVKNNIPSQWRVITNKQGIVYPEAPLVVINTTTDKIEKDHGIPALDMFRDEIMTALDAAEPKATRNTTPPVVEKSEMGGMNEKKHQEAEKVKTPPTPAPETKPPKITTPPLLVPMCVVCHTEVSQMQAMDCKMAEEPFHHPECKLPESKEPQKEKKGDEIVNEAKEPAKSQTPIPAGTGLLDLIKSYVGDDVLEIFGDSGTGKSKLALELARQVLAAGKTVYYLDTERNLTDADITMLKGCQYKYTPVVKEIGTITQKLPKVDVVILDSIGFPILTEYARMNMKQKGEALLNMIAIFGDLKEWAYLNKGVAVVINQPESDFNKEPFHLIRPFGDKSQFAAKEIWKTEITQRGSVTKTDIQAFRSRSVGHKTLIAKMEVSNTGTIIKEVK